MSLRLKLTLWITTIALVIHLTLTAAVLLYQRVSVRNFFDLRFQPRLAGMVAGLRGSNFEIEPAAWDRLAREHLSAPTGDPYLAAVYRTGEGVIAATGPHTPPESQVLSWLDPDTELAVHRESRPYEIRPRDVLAPSRTFVQRIFDAGGREHLLVVMVTDVPAASVLSVLSSVLMMTIPAGVLAAGASGWLISGLIMRPLMQLRQLAGSLAPELLDQPMAVGSTVPELRILQNELEDSRERLRSALVAHDRFISNVSHELKTPVAVLLTEAQTIDRAGLTQDQARFIDSVTDEMRRLGRMVESFLTLTRVRAGKAIANADRCELNDVIMQSVETCSAMARQQSVTLEPRLAEAPHGAEIFGDFELLRIMVDNLIRNAIRFSPPGATVVIVLESAGHEWSIRVRDDGPGIPDEMLGSLFDRFTQASTETVRGRGYGLGLSIAQGIAELHAGDISVENLPVGCEFKIRIPRAGGAEMMAMVGAAGK